jgi:hypothetical protein
MGDDPPASERANATMPIGSNLGFPREVLRLEHELQTVAGQQRLALPRFLSLTHGIGATLFRQRSVRYWHAGRARGSGCPLP